MKGKLVLWVALGLFLSGAASLVMALPPAGARARAPAAEVLPRLVSKPFRRMAYGKYPVDGAEDLDADAPDAAWHQVRIHGKRARYAAEAVAPALDDEARWLAAHPNIRACTSDVGEVSDAEKAWLYANTRGVVFPAVYEGFGLVPFEAAAAGAPCIFAWQTALRETLPEDAATGSSMMPQKLNADVAELARGKAGTAIGRLTGLLATVKGLPLAYNKDLQETQEPLFAASDALLESLRIAAGLMSAVEFDTARMPAAAAIKAATLNAADLLGITAETGSIEPGKRANLLLMRADPAQTIDAYDAITQIILRGQVIDRSSLAATK